MGYLLWFNNSVKKGGTAEGIACEKIGLLLQLHWRLHDLCGKADKQHEGLGRHVVVWSRLKTWKLPWVLDPNFRCLSLWIRNVNVAIFVLEPGWIFKSSCNVYMVKATFFLQSGYHTNLFLSLNSQDAPLGIALKVLYEELSEGRVSFGKKSSNTIHLSFTVFM